MSKEILHMRIDSDTKEALKEIAAADNRNLSNLIEKILQDYVKAHKDKS